MLAAGLVIPSLAASPVLASYPAWKTVNGLSERFLEALDRSAGSEPPGATLVLLNLPSSLRENDGDHGVTRSAAGLWPRSVRVWAAVQGHPQQVIALGASDHVGAPGVPEVRLEGEELSVFFPPGPSAYGNPDADARVLRAVDAARGRGLVFAWPPDGVRDAGPIIPLLFDGEGFVRVIR